jgi:ribose/xylose/arabinose/galactoside ABC-type transport system permease subunit
MISGILDLSGATLAAVLFAALFSAGHIAWPAALTLAIGASFLIGIFNAWVVIRLKIPAIVTLLITGSIVAGLAYLIAEKFGTSMQIHLIVPQIRLLWTIKPLGMPLTVYIMFAFYILVYILMNQTRLGAHLYAIGANPDAASRAGINYFRLFVFVFILYSMMASLGSIIWSVRVMNAGPFIGPSLTSGAGVAGTLVACLFAGIGLFGGSGRVEFTLVGLLFMGVLLVGMSVVGFPAELRVAVDGLSILAALMLDALRRHLSTR